VYDTQSHWASEVFSSFGIQETRTQRRITSSETLRRVALVRTDVLEELYASFIRVTRIGEL
jgi:hypothetical protein